MNDNESFWQWVKRHPKSFILGFLIFGGWMWFYHIDKIPYPPVCNDGSGEDRFLEGELNEGFKRNFFPYYWRSHPDAKVIMWSRAEAPSSGIYYSLVADAMYDRLFEMMGLPRNHRWRFKYFLEDLLDPSVFGKDWNDIDLMDCDIMREVALKGGRYAEGLPPGSFRKLDENGNLLPKE